MYLFTGFYTLIVRGGIFMIPLLIAGTAAIALTIERLLFLRENRVSGDRLQYELQNALKANDLDKAIVLAAKTPGIIGRVLEEGLRRVQSGETDIGAATEKIIHSEMVQMERSRDWLITIATIAPLMGIMGSVYGMIVAFHRIEESGGTDPKMLAGGLAIALICTVTGLVIAIPTTVAHDFIRKQTNQILHGMDLYLLEIGEWLGKRKTLEAAK